MIGAESRRAGKAISSTSWRGVVGGRPGSRIEIRVASAKVIDWLPPGARSNPEIDTIRR